MKIVINSDYGGFGLSIKGTERYLELKGKQAYWFAIPLMKDGYTPKLITSEEAEKIIVAHCSTSIEYSDESNFSDRDIKRDDPILIQVVQELGQKAAGKFAKLKIVEIPDGTEWGIEEYDGSEWVAEKHETWS